MAGTRRRPGRMGPFIESYRRELLGQGYTPLTVRGVLQHVGALGRWMEVHDVEVADLDVEVLDAFVASRRSCRSSVRTTSSLRSLLGHLRDVGVLGREPAAVVDPLMEAYRAWMFDDRGLAALTVLRYENLAVRFVATLGGRPLGSLNGADVNRFLLAEASRVSVESAKGRVAEMRSLLRFLFLTGRVDRDLAASVAPVAGWHDKGVPQGAKAPDVERLLAACDPATLTGCRDLAMLMLVARLGLRSAEVARLELGDLDWRAGEFAVRGKAWRADRLPLPVEVGEALTAWLQRRPATVSRRVFVTTRAPIGDIRPSLVSETLRRVCLRCGVEVIGAHRLRHGLATAMLQRGASLIEVGQVLRHRDVATTAVYAKVDLDTLRRLAQPWPQVQASARSPKRPPTTWRCAVGSVTTWPTLTGYCRGLSPTSTTSAPPRSPSPPRWRGQPRRRWTPPAACGRGG